MNKRSITIAQLIREEYLKLQKENYLKNIIHEEISKIKNNISEQDDEFLNLKDLTDNYILKGIKSGEYAGQTSFKPYNFQKTQLAGLPTSFQEQFIGVTCNNVKFSSGVSNISGLVNYSKIDLKDTGNTINNIHIPLPPVQLSHNQFMYDQYGLVGIHYKSNKNVYINVDNLKAPLFVPPMQHGDNQLTDGFIISPNITKVLPTVIIKREVVKPPKKIDSPVKVSNLDTPGQQSFINQLDSLMPNVNDGWSSKIVAKMDNSDSKLIDGGVKIAYKSTWSQGSPKGFEKGAYLRYTMTIEFVQALVRLEPQEVSGANIGGDVFSVLFPELDTIKDKVMIPVANTGELQSPEEWYDQLRSNEQEVQRLQTVINIVNTMDEKEKDLLIALLDDMVDWFNENAPEWAKKTASFIGFAIMELFKSIGNFFMEPSWDKLQILLNMLGFVDAYGIGSIADMLNCSISLSRYLTSCVQGNCDEMHLVHAALSAWAIIPGYGWAANASLAGMTLSQGAKTSRAFRKTLTKTKKTSKSAKNASSVKSTSMLTSKYFKQWTKAMAKKDVSGMSKAIDGLIKQGHLTRENLALLSKGELGDSFIATALFVRSKAKDLAGFENSLMKINKALKGDSKIDLQWASKALDDSAEYLEFMSRAFNRSYNNLGKQTILSATRKTVVNISGGSIKLVKSIAKTIIMPPLKWTAKLAIWKTAPALYLFELPAKVAKLSGGATLKGKTLNPFKAGTRQFFTLLFNTKKQFMFGEKFADFLRQMWLAELRSNPVKLATIIRSGAPTINLGSVISKNFLRGLRKQLKTNFPKAAEREIDDIVGLFSGQQMSGNQFFQAISNAYNKSGKLFKGKVSNIDLGDKFAILEGLRTGTLEKLLPAQVQKDLYEEVLKAYGSAAMGSGGKLHAYYTQFSKDYTKKALTGELGTLFSQEISRQSYGLSKAFNHFNGLFTRKGSDVVFEEVEAVMQDLGIYNDGSSPKQNYDALILGYMNALINEAISRFGSAEAAAYYEGIKSEIRLYSAPLRKYFAQDSGVLIDILQNGGSNTQDTVIKQIEYFMIASPGLLEGNLSNPSSCKLIRPAQLHLGNKLIPNPFLNPVYTGPKNPNFEELATNPAAYSPGSDSKLPLIGNKWHTGDGKTGRPIEKMKCHVSGIPFDILYKIKNNEKEYTNTLNAIQMAQVDLLYQYYQETRLMENMNSSLSKSFTFVYNDGKSAEAPLQLEYIKQAFETPDLGEMWAAAAGRLLPSVFGDQEVQINTQSGTPPEDVPTSPTR